MLGSGIQFGNDWIKLNADSDSDLSKKHNSKNIERSFCVHRFKLDATLLQWFLNKTVNYLNQELGFRTALPCRSPEAFTDAL